MLDRKRTQHSIQPEKADDIEGRHQQFLRERRLRNERRNSILMTRHYPDLGAASDWLKQISQAARPIRSTTQIWVATRHQYGISAQQWQRRELSHPTHTLCKGPLIGLSKSKCLPFFRSLSRSPSTNEAETRDEPLRTTSAWKAMSSAALTVCDPNSFSAGHGIYLFYLFIYRFVQCTGERTIGHVVPYLVHPPKLTKYQTQERKNCCYQNHEIKNEDHCT